MCTYYQIGYKMNNFKEFMIYCRKMPLKHIEIRVYICLSSYHNAI